MIDRIDKIDCTGCKMCADACPVGAISYVDDYEGFWYPAVDSVKCIRCQKCINLCPSLGSRENADAFEPVVYAAWNMDDDVRLRSTSGGMYQAFAKKVIDNGGVIVGCAYAADYKSARHIVGDDRVALESMIGSKYFQSDTGGIYKKVAELLRAGRTVLFCGAPCQTAALHQFIGCKAQNLFMIDFVCRGINSPKVFQKYVEDCERRFHSKATKVHLKNKKKGWTRLGTYMEFDNGSSYYRDRVTDPWVNGYVRGNLFMRPCCSVCKYKEKKRIADISVGDFWGLKNTNVNLHKGISLVLINTKKGDRLFDEIKEGIHYESHTYGQALAGNGCLLHAAPMGERREEFLQRINTADFEKLVWEMLGENGLSIWLKELKYNIFEYLRRMKNGNH